MLIKLKRNQPGMGWLVKLKLVVNDKVYAKVGSNESILVEIPNSKDIMIKGHFMTRVCKFKIPEKIYEDITKNNLTLTVQIQFINEPFVWKTPIQAIVSYEDKFVGIFKC